jgi:hypothetical protein
MVAGTPIDPPTEFPLQEMQSELESVDVPVAEAESEMGKTVNESENQQKDSFPMLLSTTTNSGEAVKIKQSKIQKESVSRVADENDNQARPVRTRRKLGLKGGGYLRKRNNRKTINITVNHSGGTLVLNGNGNITGANSSHSISTEPQSNPTASNGSICDYNFPQSGSESRVLQCRPDPSASMTGIESSGGPGSKIRRASVSVAQAASDPSYWRRSALLQRTFYFKILIYPVLWLNERDACCMRRTLSSSLSHSRLGSLCFWRRMNAAWCLGCIWFVAEFIYRIVVDWFSLREWGAPELFISFRLFDRSMSVLIGVSMLLASLRWNSTLRWMDELFLSVSDVDGAPSGVVEINREDEVPSVDESSEKELKHVPPSGSASEAESISWRQRLMVGKVERLAKIYLAIGVVMASVANVFEAQQAVATDGILDTRNDCKYF